MKAAFTIELVIMVLVNIPCGQILVLSDLVTNGWHVHDYQGVTKNQHDTTYVLNVLQWVLLVLILGFVNLKPQTVYISRTRHCGWSLSSHTVVFTHCLQPKEWRQTSYCDTPTKQKSTSLFLQPLLRLKGCPSVVLLHVISVTPCHWILFALSALSTWPRLTTQKGLWLPWN